MSENYIYEYHATLCFRDGIHLYYICMYIHILGSIWGYYNEMDGRWLQVRMPGDSSNFDKTGRFQLERCIWVF